MKKRVSLYRLLPIYILVLAGCICAALFGSAAVTTMVENAPIENRTCIIVDAGHGGIDGGATSISGTLESQINLQISLRINDLLCFLGYDTIMVRTSDTSIHTEGDTIGAQKVSDLKQRVKLVNETENAVLISIHQNTFIDEKYSGAQVFYAEDDVSRSLASELQALFAETVNPGSNRKSKSAKGIYLMQSIRRPGVLIECGFISNREEETKLKDPQYQKKLACVIGSGVSSHFR